MANVNALFAVVATSNPEAMQLRVSQIAPWLTLEVEKGQWLVIAPSSTTTKELSDRLGISDGTISNGIVLKVETYFGRTAPSTWEWVSAKMGAPLVTTAA